MERIILNTINSSAMLCVHTIAGFLSVMVVQLSKKVIEIILVSNPFIL